MRLLLLYILSFFFAFTSPAYAHGEEVIVTLLGVCVLYLSGLLALIIIKASKSRKMLASVSLLAGVGMLYLLAQMPDYPGFSALDLAIILSACCAVGLSVWIQKPAGWRIKKVPFVGNLSELNEENKHKLEEILASPKYKVTQGNIFGGSNITAADGQGVSFDAKGNVQDFFTKS